jgi:quercetin dioxygenase-like cupin family protein
MCSSDKERCYVVLRGSITVQDEQGNNHVLDENDMIYIAPGENRAMSVNGTAAANVYSEDDKTRYDPKQRASMAMPYQPAIYIE